MSFDTAGRPAQVHRLHRSARDGAPDQAGPGYRMEMLEDGAPSPTGRLSP